jgi:hypothetical protein
VTHTIVTIVQIKKFKFIEENMDLGELQYYASLAVEFDHQKNYEAARYYYLQASALIDYAVTGNHVRLQVCLLSFHFHSYI